MKKQILLLPLLFVFAISTISAEKTYTAFRPEQIEVSSFLSEGKNQYSKDCLSPKVSRSWVPAGGYIVLRSGVHTALPIAPEDKYTVGEDSEEKFSGWRLVVFDSTEEVALNADYSVAMDALLQTIRSKTFVVAENDGFVITSAISDEDIDMLASAVKQREDEKRAENAKKFLAPNEKQDDGFFIAKPTCASIAATGEKAGIFHLNANEATIFPREPEHFFSYTENDSSEEEEIKHWRFILVCADGELIGDFEYHECISMLSHFPQLLSGGDEKYLTTKALSDDDLKMLAETLSQVQRDDSSDKGDATTASDEEETEEGETDEYGWVEATYKETVLDKWAEHKGVLLFWWFIVAIMHCAAFFDLSGQSFAGIKAFGWSVFAILGSFSFTYFFLLVLKFFLQNYPKAQKPICQVLAWISFVSFFLLGIVDMRPLGSVKFIAMSSFTLGSLYATLLIFKMYYSDAPDSRKN